MHAERPDYIARNGQPQLYTHGQGFELMRCAGEGRRGAVRRAARVVQGTASGQLQPGLDR